MLFSHVCLSSLTKLQYKNGQRNDQKKKKSNQCSRFSIFNVQRQIDSAPLLQPCHRFSVTTAQFTSASVMFLIILDECVSFLFALFLSFFTYVFIHLLMFFFFLMLRFVNFQYDVIGDCCHVMPADTLHLVSKFHSTRVFQE